MKTLDTIRVLASLLSLQRSQWWPAERIEKFHRDRLVETLRYAVTNVPYYRSFGISASSIASHLDLERFPILRKSDLQERAGDLLAAGFDPACLASSRTSGSTGEPTIMYFDRDCLLTCRYAIKMRKLFALTSPLFKRLLVIRALPVADLPRRKQWPIFAPPRLFRIEFKSLFEPLDSAIDFIEDYRPDILYSYPSFLVDLTQEYRSRGLVIPEVPLIFTSSERLTASTRRRIEQSFGARVCDVYGSTEFNEVAWQCERGRYHVNFESTYVEVQPDSSAADDRTGALILTSLQNRAMPLIRFSIGDRGCLAREACACGRASTAFEAFDGRDVDLVTLPSGRRVSPYVVEHWLERHPVVKRYQVIHSEPAKLRIEFTTFDNELPARDFEAVGARIREAVGAEMIVELKQVDRIEKEGGGKYQPVRREF